jgi:hypothetical protein
MLSPTVSTPEDPFGEKGSRHRQCRPQRGEEICHCQCQPQRGPLRGEAMQSLSLSTPEGPFGEGDAVTIETREEERLACQRVPSGERLVPT